MVDGEGGRRKRKRQASSIKANKMCGGAIGDLFLLTRIFALCERSRRLVSEEGLKEYRIADYQTSDAWNGALEL